MDSINAIVRLNQVFKDKDWHKNDIDNYVFKQFCILLDNLDDDEKRRLIIELAEKYTWITSRDYEAKMLSIFNDIDLNKIETLKKIYLFPIIKPEDEGKVKSGIALLYSFKSFTRLLPNYKNIRFEIFTSFKSFEETDFNLRSDEAIFIVDDYIGSGETLRACLDKIQENAKIQNSDINVISIASQKNIYDVIKKENYNFYINHLCNRGISDYYASPELEENISIMKEIEKIIPGVSFFSFGYGEAEGLITMMRTPDNTFPIFWKEYKIGNKKFEAPFSRDLNMD